MKKTINKVIFLLFFISLLVFLWAVIFVRPKLNNIGKGRHIWEEAKKEELTFDFVGEKITYDIKLKMVNLGTAVFQYVGKTQLNRENANLVTFKTQIPRFNDLEKIYSDSKSFLPVRVERYIRSWPSQEKIIESYDQDKFSVTITKFKGKNKEEIFIQRDGIIHNAILLPFYVRRQPRLNVGWLLKAKLPRQEFLIRLVSIENVKVPAGTFKAYHFESTPKKFQIWITTDSRRIPVKIIGSGSLGYVLLMKDYSLAK